MSTTSVATRWWLLVGGQVDGPRTQGYVLAAVQSGQLPASIQACPEGTTQWQPLTTWPPFSHLQPIPTPPPPSTPVGLLITNPQLPLMANAICVFTIVVLPVNWLVAFALTWVPTLFSSSAPDGISLVFGLCIDAPLTLTITAVLAIGGLLLRDRRVSGSRLIRIGLWCDFIAIVFRTLLLVVAVIAMSDVDSGELSGFEILAFMFQIVLGGTVFAFEIAALIWLTRNEANLALRAD